MNILGIGGALPRQVVTNHQLESILDTDDAWIVSRTGIHERRIMPGQDLTSLALEAARGALADAGITGDQLDYILVATTLGDMLFPSLACLLQAPLGATCPAMDVHAACTGFLYALDVAQAYLASGRAQHILVVGAEAVTRLANWADRTTAVLFGDGAGAVVVGPGEGLLSMHLNAQTNRDVLYSVANPGSCPFTKAADAPSDGLHMAGQDVFRFAVSQSPKDLEAAAAKAGVTLQDMDWVLVHQANQRIIDAVGTRLGLGAGKMPSNIHRTGNTSAASIPLLLWELYHTGLLQSGHLVALSAFGAGLTSGACIIRWTKPAPLPSPVDNDLFLTRPAN